jgi:DNA-binding MarR family transcriptional regulator
MGADDEPIDRAAEAALLASRALLGVVAASLEPVLDQVTLPQFRVLVLVHGLGPTPNGVLARRLGVHPSTFSRTADRLIGAGFLRRLDSPESRREILVDLTPTGRKLVTGVQRRRIRRIRNVLTALTPEQRDLVIQAFTLFADAADEPRHEELAALLGV